mmetsp:Transcript_38009/g.95557  ORF Transcript_38009/g.95557 Transcript_38009/m.95557 type:complete len:242 (-) Transcript_38009:291-1016(-)
MPCEVAERPAAALLHKGVLHVGGHRLHDAHNPPLVHNAEVQRGREGEVAECRARLLLHTGVVQVCAHSEQHRTHHALLHARRHTAAARQSAQRSTPHLHHLRVLHVRVQRVQHGQQRVGLKAGAQEVIHKPKHPDGGAALLLHCRIVRVSLHGLHNRAKAAVAGNERSVSVVLTCHVAQCSQAMLLHAHIAPVDLQRSQDEGDGFEVDDAVFTAGKQRDILQRLAGQLLQGVHVGKRRHGS